MEPANDDPDSRGEANPDAFRSYPGFSNFAVVYLK